MRTRRFRLPTALVATGAVALALTACGAEVSTSSADSDEPLVVYVGRDEELVSPLIDQFSEESGVEVEARYAGTPDQLALLLEEGAQTPADVFLSQDGGALGALAAEGNLKPLPEEITSAVLPEFTSADGSWVGVTGRARVIAYNPDKVPEAQVPSTVAALTAPEWKGRVGFPPGNASFQAFVTGFRSAQGDEAAKTWLTGMVANDAQTFESNGDTLQAVENGVIDLGLINHYYLYELAAEIGQDKVKSQLQFPTAGDPGALVNVTGAAALSDHPDAQAFISFLVSEQGQKYFVENTYEYPLVPGIAAPEGLPELTSLKGPVADLADLADVGTSISMIEEAGLS